VKEKSVSRLAWSVGTVSIALMIGALVMMFIDRHTALPDAASAAHWDFSNVLSTAVNGAVPSIGIVLASKRPQNPDRMALPGRRAHAGPLHVRTFVRGPCPRRRPRVLLADSSLGHKAGSA
jgi:hypothetical protein